MRLRTMNSGESGTVNALTNKGALGLCLRKTGLTPETKLHFDSRIPLQDPVRFRLKGRVHTLRPNKADQIGMYLQGEN